MSGVEVDGIWICRERVPPYYSNAVILAPSPVAQQQAAIARLADEIVGVFSVKDSFATLDLAPLGFRQLFEASWIGRPPLPLTASPWSRITAPADLQEWQAAWQANGSPTDRPVFLDPILGDPDIGFFATRQAGRIVAGCIANRSETVVGLSNVFSASGDSRDDYAAAAEAASGFAPGLPIAGYESGDSLATAKQLGFHDVGPLRIWLRNET